MPLGVARRRPHLESVVEQTLDDLAPEKAGSAENRDQAGKAGSTAASLLVNGTLNSSARSFLHRSRLCWIVTLQSVHELRDNSAEILVLWVNLKGRERRVNRCGARHCKPFKANDLTLSLHDHRG